MQETRNICELVGCQTTCCASESGALSEELFN